MLERNYYIFVIDVFFSYTFLSTGNIVGVVIFLWGRIWGNNICRVVTKFEITVLKVTKLQKNNTPKLRIN